MPKRDIPVALYTLENLNQFVSFNNGGPVIYAKCVEGQDPTFFKFTNVYEDEDGEKTYDFKQMKSVAKYVRAKADRLWKVWKERKRKRSPTRKKKKKKKKTMKDSDNKVSDKTKLKKGNIYVDDSKGTLIFIFDKQHKVVTSPPKDENTRQFIQSLIDLKNNETWEKMVAGKKSGSSLTQPIMNHTIAYGRAPLLKDQGIQVVEPKLFRNKEYKSVGTKDAGNQKNKNAANDYDIFDSPKELRVFFMAQLNKIIEMNTKYCIIDPCSGLGRLTPTITDLHGRTKSNTRILAYDLVPPTGEHSREKKFPTFKKCIEVCSTKNLKWGELQQPGVDITRLNFFDAKADTYSFQEDEEIIFVMNPPFTLRDKRKNQLDSGIHEFIKQCCKICKEANRNAHILTVMNRGFTDFWKDNFKNMVYQKTKRAIVEIKTVFYFKDKDARRYFMRVNDNTKKYDMLATDIAVCHLYVHQTTTNPQTINFIDKDAWKTCLQNRGFYVGYKPQNKTARLPMFNVKNPSQCPVLLRLFGSAHDLGEVLFGCADRTDNTEIEYPCTQVEEEQDRENKKNEKWVKRCPCTTAEKKHYEKLDEEDRKKKRKNRNWVKKCDPNKDKYSKDYTLKQNATTIYTKDEKLQDDYSNLGWLTRKEVKTKKKDPYRILRFNNLAKNVV